MRNECTDRARTRRQVYRQVLCPFGLKIMMEWAQVEPLNQATVVFTDLALYCWTKVCSYRLIDVGMRISANLTENISKINFKPLL